MKYSSFATIAAALALFTTAGSHPTTASAKAETAAVASHTPATVQTPGALYAQAARFGEPTDTRLDAQPVSASAAATVSSQEEHAPFNLLALVVAGIAVMGSLAFRRAPHK